MDCKATCTIGANIAKAAFVGPSVWSEELPHGYFDNENIPIVLKEYFIEKVSEVNFMERVTRECKGDYWKEGAPRRKKLKIVESEWEEKGLWGPIESTQCKNYDFSHDYWAKSRNSILHRDYNCWAYNYMKTGDENAEGVWEFIRDPRRRESFRSLFEKLEGERGAGGGNSLKIYENTWGEISELKHQLK